MHATTQDDRAPLVRDVAVRGLMVVGGGEARAACARLIGERVDPRLAALVTYNIAEGYSREAGNPAGDPMRFHEWRMRHVGAPLPDGLDFETLLDRARDAIADGEMFAGLSVAEIEEQAQLVGADILREAAPRP